MTEKGGRLTDLLATWSEARQRGERLTAEDLCHDHPALLAEVRLQIPKLEAMSWLDAPDEELGMADGFLSSSGIDSGTLHAFSIQMRESATSDDLDAAPLEAFQQSLLDTGLVSLDEFKRLFGGPGDCHVTTTHELASELIRLGKLTTFQVQMLAKGKGNRLILGNYILLDKLGAGGMGQVFKARHRRMKRVVALKLLSETLVNSPLAIDRFRREVEAAAKLDHPNIVTSYDADEADGRHFLAMQYIEGSDLAKIIRNRGPLSVGQAIHVLIQTAQGLDYAHQRGIIHRDIKPSNLLIAPHGHVKILDMGLARIEPIHTEANASTSDLTQEGMVMGTVDYMAPEQAEDTRHADQRADLYSLGGTLYFLLTGQAMYQGTTMMAKLIAHREQPIPPLQAGRGDIPPELDAIFQKMVAKKPGDRFPSMSALLTALKSLLDRVEPVQTPSLTSTDFIIQQEGDWPSRKTSSAGIEATIPNLPRPPVPVPSRWRALWATLIVFLLLGSLAYFVKPHWFHVQDGWFDRGNSKGKIHAVAEKALPNAPGVERDRDTAEWARGLNARVLVAQRIDDRWSGTALSPAEPLPNGPFILVTLDFASSEKIKDSDLSEIRDLPNLEYLNLSNCPITDAGLKQLANLPKLREIYLDRTNIGDEGCKSLAAFGSLVVVLLEDTRVTSQGVADLKKALPRVAIRHNN